MKLMAALIFVGLLIPGISFSANESCFPISRARHDYHCYSLNNEKECLDTQDAYSCGWGQRTQEAPSDDDLLVCDDSRCSKRLDGDDEDFVDLSRPQQDESQ